jgi:hypothetical protein
LFVNKVANRWIEKVLALPCVVCDLMGLTQQGRTYAHHCFDTAHRSDYLTIPLCNDHHQGGNGFHTLGAREFARRYRTDETHLIAETIRRIAAMR